MSVTVLLVYVAALAATSCAAPLPNVTYRVEETLSGLFFHYWRHDPNAKQIGYFFDCSQIGSIGDWNHCTCENVKSCTNCYRWWDAVALEAIANHGIYTKTKANASVADMLWAHSPYNQKWDGTALCTYVDDFAWYSMAYLRVYEWLKVGANEFKLMCTLNILSFCLRIRNGWTELLPFTTGPGSTVGTVTVEGSGG